MKCIIDSKIHIDKSSVPEDWLYKIKEKITYENPEYRSRRRYDYYTGNTDATIKGFTETTSTLTVPRGILGYLRSYSSKMHYPLEIIDNQLSFITDLNTSMQLKLRAYQFDAYSNFRGSKQGVVVVPCGGGKTVIALKTIHRLQQPTLIIVHTHDLLTQWVDNIKKHLKVNDIGIISGFEKNVLDITVATIQSLNNYDLDEIKDRFGFIILDEAHHVPANTFRKVINHFPAKYRLGLSATPFREDGLDEMLFDTMGEIAYEIDYPRLISGGYLIEPTYTEIPTEFNYSPTKVTKTGRVILDWHRMTQRLINDVDRGEVIISQIRYAHKKGELGLVLSGRIGHLEYFYRIMKEYDYKCELLVGSTPKEKRKQILDDAKAGKVDLLFSANISDEGLDLPNLNTVYLTYPNKSEAKVIQRIGRILRPFPGKTTAQIFDFVDSKVGVLKRQADKRQKIITKTFWRKQ